MNKLAKQLIKEIKKNISHKRGSVYLYINPIEEDGKRDYSYNSLKKLRDLIDEFVE